MKSERWGIIHIDLASEWRDIPSSDEIDGVHVQIWKGALPLGLLWFPREVLPMKREELAREISRAIAPAVGDRLLAHGFRAPLPVIGENPARDVPADLEALLKYSNPISEVPTPGANFRGPSVTVIVCTRNRPESLEQCLASLTRLDPAPDEILVVDNDPATAGTRAVVEKFPGIKWLPEPNPGLSRARNTGIRHAKGEIIAWTDDDTSAHPDWIGRIRAVFEDPAIFGMTGLVLAGSLDTSAQVRFERDFGGFQRGFRRFTLDQQFFEEMKDRGVPTWLAGAGANMAFRREVFEKLGPFDERLGAGAAGCSEDSEYWYRMLAAGMSIRYEPSAVVHHFHRVAEEDFQFQMEEYMRGHVAALLFQYRKHGHAGNLRRVFLSLPRYYLAISRQRLAGAARGTLGAELRGCLKGILYYLRNNC
jgi:GT2 family glycosyltransferase